MEQLWLPSADSTHTKQLSLLCPKSAGVLDCTLRRMEVEARAASRAKRQEASSRKAWHGIRFQKLKTPLLSSSRHN